MSPILFTDSRTASLFFKRLTKEAYAADRRGKWELRRRADLLVSLWFFGFGLAGIGIIIALAL